MHDDEFVEFERLIRAYISGQASWDEVHDFAIELEWKSKGELQFPERLREPLEALHFAFLTADENDDPQFRADRAELIELLRALDEARESAS